MAAPVFKRILLKLSGEALAAGQGFGVDVERVHQIAAELQDACALDVQIAIVVGGGNFFRGVAEQAREMDRVSADHMGMLATVINALALQDALEKRGVYTRVMSAIEMNQVAEPFIRRRAIRHRLRHLHPDHQRRQHPAGGIRCHERHRSGTTRRPDR